MPSFNSRINLHNPRQCFITKNWSRYLSFYQLGFGSDRGIGVRDGAELKVSGGAAVLPLMPPGTAHEIAIELQ